MDHYENALRSHCRLYVRSVLVVTACAAMEHINTVCQILEVLLIFIWRALVMQLFWQLLIQSDDLKIMNIAKLHALSMHLKVN